jgi:hypothetical protein
LLGCAADFNLERPRRPECVLAVAGASGANGRERHERTPTPRSFASIAERAALRYIPVVHPTESPA